MEPPCRRVEVSAPGKVILHGEHAVVYGEPAVAASLDLRTVVTIEEEEPAGEPTVSLHFPAVELELAVPLRAVLERLLDPAAGADAWREPQRVQHERHLGAVDAFVGAWAAGAAAAGGARLNALRGFLYLLRGVGVVGVRRALRVTARSALAVGAGTGSSAAFAASAAGALLRLRGAASAAQFGAEERRLISAWAFNCERIMHGAPSGIDNTTCTFGALVWFRRGAEPRALRSPTALRVLLVHTGVSRQTKAMTARVAALRARNERAVQSVMAACGHVAERAAAILEELADDEAEDTEELYRQLAELWDMNHCLLSALGVSHRALDDVRACAADCGLAAKLTGAGGGGYAMVLVPPHLAASAPALAERLRARGYRVSDTRLGGAGVAVHQ